MSTIGTVVVTICSLLLALRFPGSKMIELPRIYMQGELVFDTRYGLTTIGLSVLGSLVRPILTLAGSLRCGCCGNLCCAGLNKQPTPIGVKAQSFPHRGHS